MARLGRPVPPGQPPGLTHHNQRETPTMETTITIQEGETAKIHPFSSGEPDHITDPATGALIVVDVDAVGVRVFPLNQTPGEGGHFGALYRDPARIVVRQNNGHTVSYRLTHALVLTQQEG